MVAQGLCCSGPPRPPLRVGRGPPAFAGLEPAERVGREGVLSGVALAGVSVGSVTLRPSIPRASRNQSQVLIEGDVLAVT